MKPLAALLVLCLAAGCSSRWLQSDEAFPVEAGAPDLLKIIYVEPVASTNESPRIIRVDLSGRGHLALQIGRSERITDAFSQNTAHASWNDVETDQLFITADEARVVLQRVVDLGFFRKDFGHSGKPAGASGGLIVTASIAGRRKVAWTDAAAMRDILADLLRLF